jgi:hypothetical protein
MNYSSVNCLISNKQWANYSNKLIRRRFAVTISHNLILFFLKLQISSSKYVKLDIVVGKKTASKTWL